MKRFFITLFMLCTAAISYAQPALKPATLFTNVSTVQEGTPKDMHVQYDEATWSLETFGNMSTFTATIDSSTNYPCDTATYYPISTMTEATTVLERGIDLTGERCFRANLRVKTGSGGISLIEFLPRGTQ